MAAGMTDNKPVAVSLATAKFMPVFLLGCIVYASYVVIHPLTIKYLLSPPRGDIPRRLVLGIVFPTIYSLLLIPVIACYIRLLLVVFLNPGYVPLGLEKKPDIKEPQPGLEEYWRRDAFICDQNGMPIWCFHCNNWKPDRTHHNQDTARCTRKMDHFCPWVGGVVGERAFKFFMQFLFYTMIFTAYLTGILAWVVQSYKGDVHLFVAIGLAGFFLLFSAGMVMNGLNMVFKNVTTIELVSKRIYMAVILPPERQTELLAPPPPAKLSSGSSDHESERPTTSELDDPSHINYFQRQQSSSSRRNPSPSKPSRRIWKGTITYPLHLPTDRPPIPAPPQRAFAILQLPPGLNPWNLGSVYANFTAVFGEFVVDWLLPLKHSPCCDHSSDISEYPLGPEFELMLRDAGLANHDSSNERRGSLTTGVTSSSERKRRRRVLDKSWQNGERPDAWDSHREARRMRKQWRERATASKHPDRDPDSTPEHDEAKE
ncbi:unnamed protein product [Zymoseptoria tritici ST99CH_3D1]|uniref:Palmitoyltransferase n=1 Tax=Zymoseptoria tritici ST99CH_1E4 TaxID=1276532 RepID=A0A2H1G6L7_ZYMTR|nr:unnamed protein product [Zymoseptoria tritici ST99CH_1E4]SMR50384.1 unnamed protein product [Zymoseptoria tritici ST99CH_3D1]